MATKLPFQDPQDLNRNPSEHPRRRRLAAGLATAAMASTVGFAIYEVRANDTRTAAVERVSASGSTQELMTHLQDRTVGQKLTVVDVPSLLLGTRVRIYRTPLATSANLFPSVTSYQVFSPEVVRNTEDNRTFLCVNLGGNQTGCFDPGDEQSTADIQVDSSTSGAPVLSPFDPNHFKTRVATVGYVDPNNGLAYEIKPASQQAGEDGRVPLAQALSTD